MTQANPVGAGNAIDSVAFVLQFSRHFNEQEVNALLSLQTALLTDFPRFDTTKSVSMRLPALGEAPQHSEVRISGVTLQRFQPSGKPEWTLQVNENQIVASCFRYARWNAVWQQSRRWLASTVERVATDDNPVTAMAGAAGVMAKSNAAEEAAL